MPHDEDVASYLLVFCADGDCFVWQLTTGMLERRVRTTPSVASPHLAPSVASLPLASARDAIASSMPQVTPRKLENFRRCTRVSPLLQVGFTPMVARVIRHNVTCCGRVRAVCMVWWPCCIVRRPLLAPV